MARVLAAHAAKMAAVRPVAAADLAQLKLLTCTLYEEVKRGHAWSACPFGSCGVARQGTGEADRGEPTGAPRCWADGAAAIEGGSPA